MDCSTIFFFKLEFNLSVLDSSVLYVLLSSGFVRRFALQFKDTLNLFTKYRYLPLNVRIPTWRSQICSHLAPPRGLQDVLSPLVVNLVNQLSYINCIKCLGLFKDLWSILSLLRSNVDPSSIAWSLALENNFWIWATRLYDFQFSFS